MLNGVFAEPSRGCGIENLKEAIEKGVLGGVLPSILPKAEHARGPELAQFLETLPHTADNAPTEDEVWETLPGKGDMVMVHSRPQHVWHCQKWPATTSTLAPSGEAQLKQQPDYLTKRKRNIPPASLSTLL